LIYLSNVYFLILGHNLAKAINNQYAKVYKKKLFPTTLSKIKDLWYTSTLNILSLVFLKNIKLTQSIS